MSASASASTSDSASSEKIISDVQMTMFPGCTPEIIVLMTEFIQSFADPDTTKFCPGLREALDEGFHYVKDGDKYYTGDEYRLWIYLACGEDELDPEVPLDRFLKRFKSFIFEVAGIDGKVDTQITYLKQGEEVCALTFRRS